jgi:predicted site-specific integrase-resolvase
MIIRVRVHRDQGRDFSYKPVQKSMADKPSPKQGLWKRRAGGRMLIGYMRVSTGEQSLDLQRDALGRAGCERVYDDVCSGRATERPGLAKALDVARKGDALVVWKLDRIGRSLAHVVGLVGEAHLAHDRQRQVYRMRVASGRPSARFHSSGAALSL